MAYAEPVQAVGPEPVVVKINGGDGPIRTPVVKRYSQTAVRIKKDISLCIVMIVGAPARLSGFEQSHSCGRRRRLVRQRKSIQCDLVTGDCGQQLGAQALRRNISLNEGRF